MGLNDGSAGANADRNAPSIVRLHETETTSHNLTCQMTSTQCQSPGTTIEQRFGFKNAPSLLHTLADSARQPVQPPSPFLDGPISVPSLFVHDLRLHFFRWGRTRIRVSHGAACVNLNGQTSEYVHYDG
jgi:hypothetical protein